MSDIKAVIIELDGVYPPLDPDGEGLHVCGVECLLRQIDFDRECPEQEIGSYHAGGNGYNKRVYEFVCTKDEFIMQSQIMGYTK